MKKKFSESIQIPEGISCHVLNETLFCKNSNHELSRNIKISNIVVGVSGDKINISCDSGNKKEYKYIKSLIAHIKNMFKGLDKHFVYTLQACNVHFPMTLKVEKNNLVINNFLGEKKPRFAIILPHVKTEIKGQEVILSSFNKEAIGQTLANIEKSTRVRGRDRRIFQDGIYLTSRGES